MPAKYGRTVWLPAKEDSRLEVAANVLSAALCFTAFWVDVFLLSFCF